MIILHGEDALKSYGRLSSLIDERRAGSVDISIMEAGELDITNTRQLLGSAGLFSDTKCLVIKNLLSGTKSRSKDKIIELLKQETQTEIVLWEDKNLSATTLKRFPQAKIENFVISPVIFKFLDNIRPGNTKSIIYSWKNLLHGGTEPEFVFAMLVRQIKLLIQAKTGPAHLKLAPYPSRLIMEQARSFSSSELLDYYQDLYQIDRKVKTGIGGNSLEHLLTNFLHKI